ncbi:GNAT family N-acetyltransferase [Celeribacter neptunius]|uniref:L-ornithine N(alpha)-acyltransferase n=1 Tax=Celeribacter neptunius TaxID=588602 RepID=A0A1I3LE15_9RHOB|nr:GNAT family N-acyltransferase [Celeribacter neptunius]SFI82941.1 ornithine-acyl[acyl carrier protein] N-acyltransferase [Celeribacter neptunius]
MSAEPSPFQLKFAKDEADLRAAQRLRYRVFVQELGSDGEMVDHAAELEADRFDPHYDHLMLIDPARSEDPLEQCVAVYRLLSGEKAAEIGQFYSEHEYDLAPLKASGKRLLELGRSCVAQEYRGGAALFQMWAGLAKYVIEEGFDVLFGTASFFEADVARHAEALSLLHHRHLAPEPLRARALPEHFQSMDLMPEDQIDRKRAMLAVPPLIKAYLRMGGTVGEGAFVDRAFNTVDVLLILDTDRISPRQRALYTKGIGG